MKRDWLEWYSLFLAIGYRVRVRALLSRRGVG